jgi:nucleoside 2-deoxyribosyltransferase
MLTIYLAGGLFNAGERLHNLYLERELTKLGHKVILPQRRALDFFSDGKFDTCAMAANFAQLCADPNILYVGSLDGADSDSGGSVEYGITVTATGRAVVYRTDFRTAQERELGVNAMFKAHRTLLIYLPCFFTDLGEVDNYYRELAWKIHEAIVEISATEKKINQ